MRAHYQNPKTRERVAFSETIQLAYYLLFFSGIESALNAGIQRAPHPFKGFVLRPAAPFVSRYRGRAVFGKSF